ncbi:hypothetical protein BH23VER1_BH23VER1_25400 [soil metagenome]
MANPPNAFLFDIGKVLIRFDFAPVNPAIQALSPLPNLDFLTAINEAKIAHEDGFMDDETFISKALEVAQFKGSRTDFTRIWQEVFSPNPPMIDTVRTLSRQGFSLYILSNTSGLHMDYILRTWDVFDCFDGAIYSYDVKLSKPNPEIYSQATATFGLTPGETIYIDDRPENADAGREAGFRTFEYDIDNHGAFVEYLADNGVVV